jgi:hypothetical protein
VRAGQLAGRAHGAPCHIGRAVEARHQIGKEDGPAVGRGIPPLKAGLRALAEDGRRRHVPPGLAEDAVVQHHASDVLATRRRVEHLLESLAHHVTVALHRDHHGVGPGSLDPGGHRRRPSVERLEHLEVEVVGEGGVAPDAEHGDRPLGQCQLVDGLHQAAHRDGFAATRTQLVRADVDQRGSEVVDQVGRSARWRAGGHDLHPGVLGHPWRSMTARIRRRRTATSRSGAIPKPDGSRLNPPMNSTGARSSTDRRTSSSI